MFNLSTKAALLAILRDNIGKQVSGSVLAQDIGVSRVAIWKCVRLLCTAGYPIETSDTGYMLGKERTGDYLYPWEFGGKESLFRHFETTGSTMDRARELAERDFAAGTVVTADRQSEGRGRCGKGWTSRLGGLYFTILDKPPLALADYFLSAMLYQIAAARALGSLCGKPAWLRWPNDICINKQKIAGILTELEGKGDTISWLATGIGVNVNNPVPSGKAVSCAEVAGRLLSRREVLLKVLDEAERVKEETSSVMAYTQGNRLLASEWNSMAERLGARAAVLESSAGDSKGRLLARGVFSGVDPAGRCIIKTEDGKGTLYFNPGPVSIVFIGNEE